MFNELTQEQKVSFAAQMVIMDAMEKGHTNKDELISYMKSEIFSNAVKNYLEIMSES